MRFFAPPMVADIPEGERSILLKFEQQAVPQIEMGCSKGLYSFSVQSQL
jgi:hypothetical protein